MHGRGNRRLLALPSDSGEPIKAEIILYQFDDANVPVEVRYLNETFWLTQKEMAELFDTSTSNISMHLKNIFEEGELAQKDCLIKFRISEFNKKPTNFYNLDAIIAVGSASAPSALRVSANGQPPRSRSTSRRASSSTMRC